jgi:hypothetical protein
MCICYRYVLYQSTYTSDTRLFTSYTSFGTSALDSHTSVIELNCG